MTATTTRTHYDTLGIAPGADPQAIRRAFVTLARRFHPDVAREPNAEERMKQINAAYAVLGDPAGRAAYDARLVLDQRHQPTHFHGATAMNENNTSLEVNRTARRAGEVAIPMPIVPQSFHQLGILVLDGSASMGEDIGGMTKADAVNGAVRDLLTRFKASRQKSNFSFALVTFDEAAGVRLPITAAAAVDDNADYDPQAGRGGGTFIGSGLEEAKTLAQTFLASARKDIPASVVIVVMSDGECGNPDRSVAVANALKTTERVTLCATHFARVGHADPDAQATLKEIATDKVRGYKTVYDAESLRAFFIASVSAGRAV